MAADSYKTVVAGGRDFDNYYLLQEAIDSLPWVVSEVVSGVARGADYLGQEFAVASSLEVKKFPADWNTHGKSAGYIRNAEMAKYADALVAFWDGKSKGTKHMIDLAVKHGLYIKVVYYGE